VTEVAVPVNDIIGPGVIAVCGLLATLVQRGRRETTERFDRVERQLTQLTETVGQIDKRQDAADVERAVLRNEVDTIKDRHHLMDMLRRDGPRHRNGRRAALWCMSAATALAAVMRWG